MKLLDDKGLPLNELGLQSIKVKMTETMLTPKIGYRFADGKRVKVDALFGIRYWHVSTDFTLGPQSPMAFSRSVNWVDAVAGGRIQLALSPKAFVAIRGDAVAAPPDTIIRLRGFSVTRFAADGFARWLPLSRRELQTNWQRSIRLRRRHARPDVRCYF